MLIRNSTWTSSRDGTWACSGPPRPSTTARGCSCRPTAASSRSPDLDGATICVQSGTTTELNLESVFAARGDRLHAAVPSRTSESLTDLFRRGRVRRLHHGQVALAWRRSRPTFKEFPARILDETMSKEPLGPVVREGDDEWFDLVNWTVVRDHPGRGVRAHPGQHRSGRRLATTPRSCASSAQAGRGRASSTPGLGAPRRLRGAGDRGRGQLRRDLRPQRHAARLLPRGLNALWTEGGPALRAALPLDRSAVRRRAWAGPPRHSL